jgi:UDP-N-acetylmuramyl pentapeptide phosphotransferase/UDP-N-acetylglucosamine-1-phosphate transferase
MFGDLDKYILVFLVGLAVTYLLTPLVRGLAIRHGVVDLPDARRPHKRPTARGGGVAVVLGVHAACLMAIVFPWPKLAGGLDLIWWEKFALSSAVLVVVGVIDDIRGMKPVIKLGGQVLAAVLIWLSGTRFGQLLGHDLPPWVDCVLTVIWLVAIINAFNLIDGLDGLASGLAIISAVGLCGILLMQQVPGQVLLLVGFIGACLGFLRYNFHPASVFLGDTGSMFLGFTLGVVSLQTFNKNTFLISLTIPIMVLGVPIYDALLAIWRRTVRSWVSGNAGEARRGIMQPDVEHLHHRLIKSGFSTQRVATFLYVLNGGLVTVGLLIMLFQSHAAGIFLIALLAGVYVLMRQLAVIELRETGRALLMGLRRPTHSTFKSLSYPVWDMVWLAGSLALIMWAIEGQRVDFWHTWFVDLPVWVTPTFSLLALSRTYVTYWQRARLRDVLMVLFWLQTGILLSLGLALVIDPAAARQWVLRAILVAGISHPVILASRLFYRCLEELVLWLKRTGDAPGEGERVLLYGAGIRGQLFLKDRAMKLTKASDNRTIMGFIDDEKALHFQWVYGSLVLGGLGELPHLIEKRRIQRVIIVSELLPESRETVAGIAAKSGIQLSEWYPEEHPVHPSAR